jgi:hypothetical protein
MDKNSCNITSCSLIKNRSNIRLRSLIREKQDLVIEEMWPERDKLEFSNNHALPAPLHSRSAVSRSPLQYVLDSALEFARIKLMCPDVIKAIVDGWLFHLIGLKIHNPAVWHI